ncbi:MFS transporter [Dactylosporangium aurantiacum]|uniref:MFS transporter n=1 Tax=Dactylosporangium aurantiacum TaxID=35754 RepID=A0A9Q9MFS6_9ACTN|nr:MFS transporter [Dactylosporangium aurantiacum]MDG6103005.1 MFS transporter [Dactylosporangium aurantiacum]UWZ57518.1 MFS transporter [Dactylosporangium aurantiacum]
MTSTNSQNRTVTTGPGRPDAVSPKTPPGPSGTATPTAGGDGGGRRPSVLRNRDFALVWGGESISLLGSEISVIALPSLAVIVFGEGALGVGLLIALQWIPFVLLAPVMGVLTDRLNRRTMMQVANLARFVILGSLPLLWALDGLTIGHLYVAAVLKGVFDVVFQLAYQAYLPQLLPREDLVDGNAKTQLSRSVALIFGRSAGGALVGALGAARAITVDAVTYLLAGLSLMLVKFREPAPQPRPGGVKATLADLRGGVSMTFGNRLLRYLTLMATFGNTAVSMVLAMIIVFGYQDLDLSAAQIGLVLGIGGTPVILGAILSRRINERLGMGRTLLLTHSMLVAAFLLLPFAQFGNTATAVTILIISQGISSFTTPVGNVGVMTLIQKATPPQAMGRVGGVALPFVWGANAAGPLLGSAIAVAFTNVTAFYLAAGLAVVAVLWVLAGRVHKLVDDVPEQERVVVPAA